jgi:hypothetical protein
VAGTVSQRIRIRNLRHKTSVLLPSSMSFDFEDILSDSTNNNYADLIYNGKNETSFPFMYDSSGRSGKCAKFYGDIYFDGDISYGVPYPTYFNKNSTFVVFFKGAKIGTIAGTYDNIIFLGYYEYPESGGGLDVQSHITFYDNGFGDNGYEIATRVESDGAYDYVQLPSYDPDAWHMWAMVNNEETSTRKIYFDGNEVHSFAYTPSTFETHYVWYEIRSRRWGNPGYILADNMWFFDNALTVQQVETMYTQGNKTSASTINRINI